MMGDPGAPILYTADSFLELPWIIINQQPVVSIKTLPHGSALGAGRTLSIYNM